MSDTLRAGLEQLMAEWRQDMEERREDARAYQAQGHPAARMFIDTALMDERHANQVADLLRAQPPPETGWRPIATAPTDGTFILTYDLPTDSCAVAYSTFIAGGWCWCDGSDLREATHWMPLPEPPK